jgi:hypothetical protein
MLGTRAGSGARGTVDAREELDDLVVDPVDVCDELVVAGVVDRRQPGATDGLRDLLAGEGWPNFIRQSGGRLSRNGSRRRYRRLACLRLA